jgi:hypothetical protein
MLKETAALTSYSPTELQAVALQEMHRFTEAILTDRVLTEAEEGRLLELLPVLGLTLERVVADDPDLADRIIVASANAGRLPSLDNPRYLLKKDEVLHAHEEASLMKEVTLREFQAGTAGFSVPFGRTGIRFRVGGIRGKTVVVGTQMQVADTGTLWITSQRAFFSGTRKSLDLRYSKLASLNVYIDGVQFHVTNRQTAPLFKVRNGEVTAALVNAAVQRAS